MEARPAIGRLLDHPWIDRPIFGVLQCARLVRAQCASQRLTKIPASPVAVVVDDAYFVIAKAVNAILIEKEKRVINKKLPHSLTLEIENIPACPGFVREKERVPVFWRTIFRSLLPVKEPQTFGSKAASCMVEHKV